MTKWRIVAFSLNSRWFILAGLWRKVKPDIAKDGACRYNARAF
jgi:hypothetical protein